MTKNMVSNALRGVLGKKTAPWLRALLVVAATAVFYAFAYTARYAKLDEFSGFRLPGLTMTTAVMFTAIYAVAFALQMRECRTLPLYALILLAVITGVILLGKISLLDYVSDDYDIFLSDWVYSYTQMNIKEGLGTYIGSDYSPPYLYLMLLISRVANYPWLYMIKAISILADVAIGYAVMKLCALHVKGEGTRLMLFHIATMLPTVVFNGAYWGQCDAIYTALCLMGLYLGLTRRSARSMIAFGVALSFKLQTVFFLPVLLPLWLRRDIKLRHVVLIPVTYMVMMVPALWGGKSLHHVLTVYSQQAGNYSFMTMNGPNIYQFLPGTMGNDTLYAMFGGMALVLGMAMMVIVCALVCAKGEKLSRESTLLACVLVLAGVPFFLPKMHERYTFGADVLSLVLAVYDPRRIALPLLFGFASYAAYTAGLPGDRLMDLKWAALFQLAGILLTAAALWRSLKADEEPACMTEVKA